MENQHNLIELKEKNLYLRQQRLLFHNLIAVANDEIIILKNLIKSKKNHKPTSETFEFFEILKENYEEYIDNCIDCMQEETNLVENTGGMKNTELYVIELEQLLKDKMKSCEFILKIIRAVRLTFN